MNLFYSVLSLIIGAGVFLVGIVMFSESLEKNASRGTSVLFKKIGDSRLVGYGVGIGVTAIVQSSTATIVTAVGLVNAGILTLTQSAFIILGTHIGATSTLFLVSLSAFDIKYLFMVLGFAGALMKIISKKGKIVRIADLFISFGILFVGLEFMSSALKHNEQIRAVFIELFRKIDFPLLLVFLGMIFTVILQSSTASKSMFIMMIAGGLLSFDNAAFLSMGAVIGSTSTALIASVTANAEAKRTAFLNFLIAIIGVAIFTSIIWLFKPFIVPAYERAVPLALQLPVFLLFYNIAVAFILNWFVSPLIGLTRRFFKDKPDTKKAFHTTYIDDHLLGTSSIAVDLTKKEILDMMNRTRANLVLAFNALVNHDVSKKKKIKKAEEKIDFLNRAIAKFIAQLSATSVTKSEDTLLGSYCLVINDVERVGDYAVKMLKGANRMNKANYKFSKKAVTQMQEMFVKVQELFDLCMEVFEEMNPERLKDVFEIDAQIDTLKSKYALGHVMWQKAGQYITSGGEYFYATISDMERIADHLTNVAVSIHTLPGEQTEEMLRGEEDGNKESGAEEDDAEEDSEEDGEEDNGESDSPGEGKQPETLKNTVQ